jgi:hypothetical protein
MSNLDVDRDDLRRFVDMLFRYADDDTYVSLRAFVDGAGTWRGANGWPVVKINGEINPIAEAAAGFAAECANAVEHARIVNHAKHNTDFFYALLVVARNCRDSKGRYSIKHYVLFRGDSAVYEVPASSVRIVDRPVIWPALGAETDRQTPPVAEPQARRTTPAPAANAERGRDSQFFEEWYPSLRPYMSKGTGTIYWRGPLTFIDGSAAEVVVGELEEKGKPEYRVVVKGEPAASTEAARSASNPHFASARQAIVQLQREIDREMFKRAHTK